MYKQQRSYRRSFNRSFGYSENDENCCNHDEDSKNNNNNLEKDTNLIIGNSILDGLRRKSNPYNIFNKKENEIFSSNSNSKNNSNLDLNKNNNDINKKEFLYQNQEKENIIEYKDVSFVNCKT